MKYARVGSLRPRRRRVLDPSGLIAGAVRGRESDHSAVPREARRQADQQGHRVTAASGSRKQGGGKDRKRVEKLVYVETKLVTTSGGEIPVPILSPGGRVGLGETDETGEQIFVPLERVRTHRNPDKRGTYRRYNDYQLPERLGSVIVTVRLHTIDDDVKRKFNRSENVRQIPPGDPGLRTLYRRRNDAESMNRHLDATLWLRRAHSVGHRRQLLNLITYVLGVNGPTMHVHQRPLAPPAAA